MKNHLEYRKDKYEPVDEQQKAIQHNFCGQKVIKQNNYRCSYGTGSAYKFRKRLEFHKM